MGSTFYVSRSQFQPTPTVTMSLSPLVNLINSKKKITFFNGAGISTSIGIPDFRSPKTGLYANLAALDLPYSEAVFDIDYFREKPQAFYTLANQLYPGTFFPSKFHYFLRLVQDKNLLKRIYTQNIDTLERLAGIKDEFIVEAHGSFASNHCIDCDSEMSTDDLKEQMTKGIPTCAKCKGYVKPDIVFFGEGLPPRFFDLWDEDCEEVEIAIVAGTSLTVYPFAALPSEVGLSTLRVLVNKDLVGDFKKKRRTDIVFLEDCDGFATEICKLLGWEKELEELITKERAFFDKRKEVKEVAVESVTKESAVKSASKESSGTDIATKSGSKESSDKTIATEVKVVEDRRTAEVKGEKVLHQVSSNGATVSEIKAVETKVSTNSEGNAVLTELDLEIAIAKLKI